METDGPTTSPSLQAELLKQKEELIQCLQEQLIGGRLRQAEMEALIRDMRHQLNEHEEVRHPTPLFYFFKEFFSVSHFISVGQEEIAGSHTG